MGWLSSFWEKESAILGPWRRARGVAGATGGFFFTLGFIFKVPLNNFPNAMLSAGTTFCVSIWSYMQERTAQHVQSQSVQVITTEAAREQLTLRLGLKQEDQPFLDQLLESLEAERNNASDTLSDLLTRYYFSHQVDVISHSSKIGYARDMLLQFGAHFIEYLLLTGFGKVETVNYEAGTTSNYAVISVSLFALWNALNGLRENIQNKPSAETLLKFVKLQHQRYQQRQHQIDAGDHTVSLLTTV